MCGTEGGEAVSVMPKALLMAGRLREAERYTQGARVATQVAAAAELRRLHAEVEALKLENNNLRWLSMRMTPAKAEEVKP